MWETLQVGMPLRGSLWDQMIRSERGDDGGNGEEDLGQRVSYETDYILPVKYMGKYL